MKMKVVRIYIVRILIFEIVFTQGKNSKILKLKNPITFLRFFEIFWMSIGRNSSHAFVTLRNMRN